MTAPSKNFTPIADTQIDADSPIDTTLMTSLRDSLINLKEWIGLSYISAQNHDHNNINSKAINDADIVKTNAVTIFDDFFDNTKNWTTAGSSTFSIINAMNGVLQIVFGGGADWEGPFLSGRPFQIGGGLTVTFEAKVARTIAGALRAGLASSVAGPTDGIYFGRDSGTTFQAITRSGGTQQTSDTGVTIDTAWHVLKIEATSSSVKFYIDGVLKATNTTYIPTTNLSPFVAIFDGAAGYVLQADYIRCSSSGRP